MMSIKAYCEKGQLLKMKYSDSRQLAKPSRFFKNKNTVIANIVKQPYLPYLLTYRKIASYLAKTHLFQTKKHKNMVIANEVKQPHIPFLLIYRTIAFPQ